MATLAARMAALAAAGRDAVVCGDWNIAHTENDNQELEGQRQEVGIPAQRAALAHRSVALGLGGRGARAASRRAGPVRVVVVAGAGVRQRRRLAHRLPVGHGRAGGRVRVSARVERAEAYALRWSDHAPVTVEYSPAVGCQPGAGPLGSANDRRQHCSAASSRRHHRVRLRRTVRGQASQARGRRRHTHREDDAPSVPAAALSGRHGHPVGRRDRAGNANHLAQAAQCRGVARRCGRRSI